MVTKLKTQIVIKLKKSNCVKSSNCDETQIVMKLKNWKSEKKIKMWRKNSNSKCDKTKIVTKLENLNSGKTQYLAFEKTQKLKLWQNFK